MTAKNYLWTMFKDPEGKDEIFYNGYWSKNDRPKVIIYED
jgi:hypothetical protein